MGGVKSVSYIFYYTTILTNSNDLILSGKYQVKKLKILLLFKFILVLSIHMFAPMRNML